MKIIFGLGNPGVKYKSNRHNIGFMVIDKLAASRDLKFKKKFRLKCSLARVRFDDEDVLLVKPSTFMNNSGICIRRAIEAYGVGVEDCLIVYDEIDLPLGAIRFKEKGGSAGHRGLESTIDNLDTNKINRLRIGVGRPDDEGDVSDYVLSDFLSSEKASLSEVISRGLDALRDWIKFGSKFVMSNYNKRGE